MSEYAPIVGQLLEAPSPIIRYKAQRYLAGENPSSATMRRLREEIKTSPIALGLLQDLKESNPSDRHGGSAIYLTMRYLADIEYPPGDPSLKPHLGVVHDWLHRLEKQYDGPLFIRDRYRVHGSFHANAIYAAIVLGLADRQTDALCTNLLRYQWPGGGWNCNKRPNTRGPSIVHTAYGLRGLATYLERKKTQEVTSAVENAANVVLERQVYLRRTNGKPLRPVFTKLSYPYPRLYDFLAGLHILTRSGHVTDPRCERALDLLESKFIPGAGWAMERKLFNHSKGKEGFTNAPWEKERLGRANLFLTVDALEILKRAGRLD